MSNNSNAPRKNEQANTAWLTPDLIKTMLGQQSGGGGLGQGQASLRFQGQNASLQRTMDQQTLNNNVSMALRGSNAEVASMLQANSVPNPMRLPVNSSVDGNSNAYQALQALGLQRLLQNNGTNASHQLRAGSNGGGGSDRTGGTSSNPESGSSGASVQTSGKDQTSMQNSQGASCVPCRARGMSMQHNFQTAYFSITPDTKHGDGLICSFPDCRNRGVKFLYCAYCKDPVAKRNFRTRHDHAGMRNGSVDPSKPIQDHQQQSRQALQGPRAGQNPPAAVSAGSDPNSEGTGSGSSVSKSIEETKKRPANGPSECSNDSSAHKKAKTGESSEPDETGETSVSPTQRKDAWEYLLSSRPSTDQGDEMSQWLMQVMSVSDRAKPMAEVAAHLDVFKSNEPSSMEEVTNESSSSVSSSRNNGGGSTDTASSGSPATESSSNEESNESSPTDGSSNGDSNDSSEENQASDSNSETQDPTNT